MLIIESYTVLILLWIITYSTLYCIINYLGHCLGFWNFSCLFLLRIWASMLAADLLHWWCETECWLLMWVMASTTLMGETVCVMRGWHCSESTVVVKQWCCLFNRSLFFGSHESVLSNNLVVLLDFFVFPSLSWCLGNLNIAVLITYCKNNNKNQNYLNKKNFYHFQRNNR